jgi:N-hydroxyarylamine O-acetyltransferase
MLYSCPRHTMNISAYLDRIHYSGRLDPDVETLRGLHRAHLYSVPFENLDIHLGRPIRLEEDAIFDKIVTQRRGGFCYELNGLFASLLKQIGFDVMLLNARVAHGDGSYGLEFDHLALLVSAPNDPATRWLADVGFGDGPLEPLQLVEQSIQTQGERSFQLVREDPYLVLAEQESGEDGHSQWAKRYAFTLQVHTLADFSPGCQYHCTSPGSTFTQKRVCTLFLPDGRATLSNTRLILTRNGSREERELTGEDEVCKVLYQIFAIAL